MKPIKNQTRAQQNSPTTGKTAEDFGYQVWPWAAGIAGAGLFLFGGPIFEVCTAFALFAATMAARHLLDN